MKRPIYTTFESVKVRLANKVQFQAGPSPADGELPDELLAQLIADAEAWVEQDLRSRYAIPFQSATRQSFAALPDHSQRALRTAIDMRSVIMVLETDFGRGSHIGADSYASVMQTQYDAYIERLLGRDREGANDKIDRYRRSPPLEDVKLASSNLADDGYRGIIINTDQSIRDSATYAADQVNDPGQSYMVTPRTGWVR